MATAPATGPADATGRRPNCLTRSTEELVWDVLLGGRRYEPPAFVAVGLSLVRANDAGLVVEPDDPEYHRVVVPNDADHFPPAAVFGLKANARPIVFPVASRAWGVVRSVFVAEHRPGDPGGGRVLVMSDLPRVRVIVAGQPVGIATAALRMG